jgi:hypothetical protein
MYSVAGKAANTHVPEAVRSLAEKHRNILIGFPDFHPRRYDLVWLVLRNNGSFNLTAIIEQIPQNTTLQVWANVEETIILPISPPFIRIYCGLTEFR